ncbi:flavin reductase family protein [Burkholderia gladioli]|nr:flavin reductase family protein [Burkholderia gladioli]
MRRITSTVTIVTADDGSRRHGMTMTAVSSLSMDPPSMIVCTHQSTFLHDILQSAQSFCVNVLRRDHVAVSTVFSGKAPPEERFQVGEWIVENSIHRLSDAQANVFCKKVAAVPFGTHTIFIGTVTDVRLNDDGEPLLYRNASYC